MINEIKINNKYLYFRRTKIIATLGPASTNEKILKKFISNNLNIFRINFSHSDAKEHLQTIELIRRISNELKKSPAILADLCGPKIRVGKFKNGFITLKNNSSIYLTTNDVIGDDNIIPVNYKNLIKEIKINERILLNDGALELKVIKKYKDKIEVKVIRGGILKDKKGLNLPETKLKISALTEKDKQDVLHCINAGVDFIALSFVRSANDVLELKNLLKEHNSDIPVIAKIEKPEAVTNIEEIIKVSDGIMIARGDLGVEMPIQKVPIIQNKIIKLTNQYSKPVIVATQMLESMIENSAPTRAEVTDVFAASLSDVDAVMLSGETAVGKFPFETFKMMDTILRESEAYQFFSFGGKFKKSGTIKKNELQNALAIATAQLSRDLLVKAIFVLTRSGNSARFVSADRPAAPIFALTQSDKVLRRLNLLWGVIPILINKEIKFKDYVLYSEKIIKDLKLAKKDDFILLLSGLIDKNELTNSIVVHQIK
ncbi:MAG TPA: pyruvate kinase [bacterium]|nr:pyruvate kinase [bacterium]HOL47513.1 pyruvate kinase [bacterium]HPQ18819.1 pyruvate kinase [bacterium]